MALSLQGDACSDIGPVRSINQDAAFVAPWAAGVADGVGGGPAGDLASAALVHRVVAAGTRVPDAQTLAAWIRIANWDLGAHVRRDSTLAGMATTFTALWCTDAETIVLAHTGDSRAYLLRDGVLTRRTRDDSLVQALVDRGIVPEADAMTHPRRNIITASLRGDASDEIRVAECATGPGDRWLLCSDGISDYLPEDAITEVLGNSDTLAAATRLVDLAIGADSRDNVTAVVADVIDSPPGRVEKRTDVRFSGSAAARFSEGIDLAG